MIIQPSLAKYRVPVYRMLAQEPGIDLKVVYGKDPGVPNVEPDGFEASFEPHRHLGIGRRRPFVWQPAQLRYADPRLADVMITVWNSRWLSLLLALRKARKRGVRTVVWGHGYSKQESPTRARLRKRVGGMADAMLFYSRRVADRYIEQGVDPTKVFVAPNGLDQEPIQAAREVWLATPDRLAVFRREQNVPEEAEPILYVSRFDPANRVDLLLHAVARLAGGRPNLRVHLVGKGEPEMTRLQNLASELGIEDRLRFLGPIYTEDELAPWFLTARAFCYPDNIGLSLHHAMGYGLPVVTGDNAATQNPEYEALVPGENGLIYPAGDADGLADSLNKLLSEERLADRLGQAALQTARTRYNLPNMCRGFLEAIRAKAD